MISGESLWFLQLFFHRRRDDDQRRHCDAPPCVRRTKVHRRNGRDVESPSPAESKPVTTGTKHVAQGRGFPRPWPGPRMGRLLWQGGTLPLEGHDLRLFAPGQDHLESCPEDVTVRPFPPWCGC